MKIIPLLIITVGLLSCNCIAQNSDSRTGDWALIYNLPDNQDGFTSVQFQGRWALQSVYGELRLEFQFKAVPNTVFRCKGNNYQSTPELAEAFVKVKINSIDLDYTVTGPGINQTKTMTVYADGAMGVNNWGVADMPKGASVSDYTLQVVKVKSVTFINKDELIAKLPKAAANNGELVRKEVTYEGGMKIEYILKKLANGSQSLVVKAVNGNNEKDALLLIKSGNNIVLAERISAGASLTRQIKVNDYEEFIGYVEKKDTETTPSMVDKMKGVMKGFLTTDEEKAQKHSGVVCMCVRG